MYSTLVASQNEGKRCQIRLPLEENNPRKLASVILGSLIHSFESDYIVIFICIFGLFVKFSNFVVFILLILLMSILFLFVLFISFSTSS